MARKPGSDFRLVPVALLSRVAAALHHVLNCLLQLQTVGQNPSLARAIYGLLPQSLGLVGKGLGALEKLLARKNEKRPVLLVVETDKAVLGVEL